MPRLGTTTLWTARPQLVRDGQRPGAVDPAVLAPTRILLHRAAVIASAVGRSLAPRQPNYRHAALYWDASARALTGAEVAGERRLLRAAVRFEPPVLALLESASAGDPGASEGGPARPADNADLDSVASWMAAVLSARGLPVDRLPVRIPRDLPPLPHGDQGVPDAASAAELGRWFGLADALLTNVAAQRGGVRPVACWSDHFDLAVEWRPADSIPRAAGAGPAADAAPSADAGVALDAQVTVGFSPGDPGIPEPYFYVTPWPLTASMAPSRRPPAGSRWHREGWLGLVLPATSILAAPDPDGIAVDFLDQGFNLARSLIGAG